MTLEPPPSEKRGWARALTDSAPYMGMGLGAALTILLALGAGYWLDGRFGTRPLFFLLGGVFGVAAAGYHFFRTVRTRR
jgi:F0F1-type ATP synthase assembly protein I